MSILIHLNKNKETYHKSIFDQWNQLSYGSLLKVVFYYSDTKINNEYVLKEVDNKLFLAINEDEKNDVHLYFKAMFILNKLYDINLVVKCKENLLLDSYLLTKFLQNNKKTPFINCSKFLEGSPLFYMNKVMIHGFSRWIELNLDKKIEESTFSYILDKATITPIHKELYTLSISEFVENNNILALYDPNYQINLNEANKLLPKNRDMSIKYFDTSKTQLVIHPRGGFGNLIFQCLFGYTQAMKLGINLVFNRDYRDVRKNISDYKLLDHLNFCNMDYIKTLEHTSEYTEPKFSYTDPNFDAHSNYITSGYFQSHKYFDSKSLELLKLHMFKDQMDLVIESKLYIDSIKTKYQKPVVLIHIRRGDYVNNSKYITLPKEYYSNAMNSLDGECVYLIFSDDIEYVKTLDVFGKKSFIICEELDVEKTFLKMTFCDHFIIANSTLSLSAYYFRNNENAMLFAPFKWFGNTFSDQYIPSDLLPSNTMLVKF